MDWSVGLFTGAVLIAFFLHGLYENEAYVARSIHLQLLGRASVLAFAVSAIAVFLLKSDWVEQSRFSLVLMFGLIVPLAAALRLGLVEGVFRRWIAGHGHGALIIGDSVQARALEDRAGSLRGFAPVEVVPLSRLRPDVGANVSLAMDRFCAENGSIGAVFVDAWTVAPREVIPIIREARAEGVDVYVLSSLLGALEGTQLLRVLFRCPVTRVRGTLDSMGGYPGKRLFDVVGAATLLFLGAPLIAVLAAVVRASSPGPILHSQTRVGRFGVPFRFYKFRSMAVNNDHSVHAEYVRAFINGQAERVVAGQIDGVYKQVHDPRITTVGRFMRKYSLDEIPQFWNVLMGDMSLVGPRPPLPYEVEYYDAWATQRLLVQPGITGMWQVAGRSRVTFDEMVLQDLVYAKNMRLVIDIRLCLHTVPAAVIGSGGG